MPFGADCKVITWITDEIYKRVERNFRQSLIESYEKGHL